MKTFEYPAVKLIVVSGDIYGEVTKFVYRLCDTSSFMDWHALQYTGYYGI
ncbi:MAG: hypothetical protein KBS95_08355 [Alistipes sp.]|nr:hypothetical protein [Candidatus Alistipes equi]